MLVISYFSSYVSPAAAWLLAFISLAYPFLLFLNIFFVIWWIVFKKWYFLISLICLLVGWNALKSSFQVDFKKPPDRENQTTIRLLTYNVRLFNYYQWTKDTMAWQRIVDYIHEINPDVVCFQEFITLPRTHHDLDNLKKNMKRLAYSHVYYTDQVPGRINFGMATFSKYPIVNKKMIDFKESLNGSISSDIIINNDTVRIINCHLQSIRLRKDYNDLLDSLIFNYSDKQLDELKDISFRMRQAFILRANQVDILSEEINSSPHPVIICGDFNDTPVSYAYRTLSKGMKDAFIESGSGVGTTFRGNFPYVRIDYVLYSSGFTSLYYHTDKVDWSDHYPVMASFTLNGKVNLSDQHSHPKE
ncbi:MAG TPA: endonuclease/exonuclease/phosphatase family protein [Bacteroidales bacterium]|nr:endonuclease/exonuclease/phosphatase family protein [Bacteroidales bacterium]